MAKACRTGDPKRQPSYCIPEALIPTGGRAVFELVRPDIMAAFIGKLVPSRTHSPVWPVKGRTGFLIMIESEDGPKEFIRVVHGSAEAFAVPIKQCL